MPTTHSQKIKLSRCILGAAIIAILLGVVFFPSIAVQISYKLVSREYGYGLLNPVILIVSIGLYFWEQAAPVCGKRVHLAARLVDIGWWLLNATIAVSVPVIVGAMLYHGGDSLPPPIKRPQAVVGLPLVLRCCLAALWVDFVRYTIHVMRHKIPFLWKFHATHHSTKELNQFSAYRLHPVDYAVSVGAASVPFYFFNIPLEGFVLHQVIAGVLGRTHHAAVNWRWPIVNWILVSPQVHRIHHSIDSRHYHCNYGLTFSIWDRLFGTYIEPDPNDIIAATGVTATPEVEVTSLSKVPETLVQQLLDPMIK